MSGTRTFKVGAADGLDDVHDAEPGARTYGSLTAGEELLV
jgi:hypothetical protein